MTNYYSKFIGQQIANGLPYGFAFDDVLTQESLVYDANPTTACSG